MKATIVQNAIGHLHVWFGEVEPVQVSKYNYKAGNKESDLYLQVDYDINDFLCQLSESDREDIDNGYTVVAEIFDEYADLI